MTTLCQTGRDSHGISMGNGSNLLVADEGVRGVVIQLLRNFNQIQVEELSDPYAGRSTERWQWQSVHWMHH